MHDILHVCVRDCMHVCIHLRTAMYVLCSYRNVTTTVNITMEYIPLSQVSCRVVLTEQLPAGMFVDQYEVARQKPFGGPQVRSHTIMQKQLITKITIK